MAKGKSFNTLFISSWKYAGACANPKELSGTDISQIEM